MANVTDAKHVASLVPVVAAALIDAQGRVLVQRRPPGKMFAGLWEFPGGKLEAGESPEAALVRELHEELGIEVAITDLLPLGFASAALASGHLLLLLYACTTWRGTPQALEADRIAWERPSALDMLAMPPADRPLVKALMRWLATGRHD